MTSQAGEVLSITEVLDLISILSSLPLGLRAVRVNSKMILSSTFIIIDSILFDVMLV